MEDRAYEILLHADVSTVYGRRGRWYLAGANRDRLLADRFFRDLCEAYPQRGVSLALVLSELNPETGLYHDRVLKSRGRVPLIQRAEIRPLTEEAKREIARAVAPAPPAREIDLGRGQAAAAAPAVSPWPWIAAACFAMAVFAALRSGF